MKKMLSILLAVCLIISAFGMICVSSGAAETELSPLRLSGTSGWLTWTLEGTELTVSGSSDMPYGWPSRDSELIELYDIKNIITKVTISEGIKSIGDYAFDSCKNLKEVTIADTVTRIGSRSFSCCDSLTDINIPGSVAEIGRFAFYSSSALARVNIVDLGSWSEIGFEDSYSNPLAYAKDLVLNGEPVTSAVIPGTVTRIGSYAFVGCERLTSVVIPDSVTSIGASAFINCGSLDSLTIGKSVLSIGDNAFSGCEGLTEVAIPDSVESIGSRAFYNCGGIKSLTIGNSVTSIGYEAFRKCTSLSDISFSDSITSVGENAFVNTKWYNDLPDGIVYTGKTVYTVMGKLPEEVVLEDGTVGIADKAFSGCKPLKKLTIPGTVTHIGESAFGGCRFLESIELPDSVTYIGRSAFYSCEKVKNVIIPKSVKYIGDLSLGYYDKIDERFGAVVQFGLKIDGFTITGYKNTAAERYAEKNGFTFISLGSVSVLGDADGSGEADAVDAAVVQRHVTRIAVPYPEEQLMLADVDADGLLTVVDASFIQRFSTNIPTPYPIGEPV